MIKTDRLLLRALREDDIDWFAALHADVEVMADLGGPFTRTASEAKLDRYQDALRKHGISRWAVETAGGEAIGYSGVLPQLRADHPLGPHCEIGWRFARGVWGGGYATESARAALAHAFGSGIEEVVSYTSVDNRRSQAVMNRIGLRRDAARDFAADYGHGVLWHGLVWAAARNTATGGV